MSKDQKRKERARRVGREKRLARERREYLANYPSINLVGTDGHAEVISMVSKAIRSFRLDDLVWFSKGKRAAFQVMREHGVGVAIRLIQRAGYTENFAWLTFFGTTFDQMYWTMPAGDLEVALLTSDIWAQPSRTGQHFDVGVRSLRQAKGPFGTIYYSPHEPRVTIDGQSYIVGLTRHAIERIYDRSGYSWRTFTGHGDAFALVYDTRHYDLECLSDGGPAAVSWSICGRGFVSGSFVARMEGSEKGKDAERYEYRVGYLPLVPAGDFAVAKTFLPPGYRNTPEQCLLQSLIDGRDAPATWRRLFDDAGPLPELSDECWQALQCVHSRGIRQVQLMERDRFVYLQNRGASTEMPRRSGHDS